MNGRKTAQKFDIAVAGGSFAGLAFVRGLVQALGPDLRIAIIDRAAPRSAVPNDTRAFAIWAGAKAVLQSLGVWEAIASEAQPMTSIEISDSALSDGIRPTRLTYDALTDEGEPAAYMVPAAVLSAALFNSIKDEPSVTWIAPAEAESLTLGEHAAEVALRDGSLISASLVVAADGKTSKLRDAAGIKTLRRSYDQTGIVTTVKFSEPHNGVAIQHFLPGGPFAILPLKGNRACITWSAAREEAARVMALDDDGFLAELDLRIGGRFGSIALDGPRQSWPLDIVIPRELVASRFALIGDAAHGVHPIAGQGVNLAFRDAAALIEVIADAARLGLDIGAGPHLEIYQRWRRFDSLMSASVYDGLNRVFGVDDIVIRAGRGAALGALDHVASVKKLILAEAAGLTGELPKLARGQPV
ncbi:2-octaprenyl-6-methoxyphenyl hydroxylase [Hyphomicrobium denitrificans 1NES1]|uniref:2-octaprenyl-6-methoxyphenyl hydroxylase n=1 Tax=Hyphomicrobium denitrificans 1NES1 TaxID=670307 RepID=N0B9E6_9HYPH|nr:FAD-dependent monooxygenase [Hyphomicrobium denitrificans]AGK59648.1 2-octaprenyl-6-methoxyphenyl hydroxylase [Hyphomicrobium denitrificans 1NES1]